jgi:hypothetical protein
VQLIEEAAARPTIAPHAFASHQEEADTVAFCWMPAIEDFLPFPHSSSSAAAAAGGGGEGEMGVGGGRRRKGRSRSRSRSSEGGGEEGGEGGRRRRRRRRLSDEGEGEGGGGKVSDGGVGGCMCVWVCVSVGGWVEWVIVEPLSLASLSPRINLSHTYIHTTTSLHITAPCFDQIEFTPTPTYIYTTKKQSYHSILLADRTYHNPHIHNPNPLHIHIHTHTHKTTTQHNTPPQSYHSTLLADRTYHNPHALEGMAAAYGLLDEGRRQHRWVCVMYVCVCLDVSEYMRGCLAGVYICVYVCVCVL